MKNKKITTSLLTAGMVLAIGITPFVHSNTMEAATLISQSDHEKVMSFTKKDLKEATGIQLEPATVLPLPTTTITICHRPSIESHYH